MVKDIARSTQKWQAGSVAAAPDYKLGVQGKGGLWLTNAIAAEANYVERVIAAANAGRRQAGLQRVGATAWEQGATQKGAANYAVGVQAPTSAAKYQANFGPILAAIAAVIPTLPPRGAPLSAVNLQRAQAVWQAAHDASEARKAAGGFTAPQF